MGDAKTVCILNYEIIKYVRLELWQEMIKQLGKPERGTYVSGNCDKAIFVNHRQYNHGMIIGILGSIFGVGMMERGMV